jgi:hypothetical protein
MRSKNIFKLISRICACVCVCVLTGLFSINNDLVLCYMSLTAWVAYMWSSTVFYFTLMNISKVSFVGIFPHIRSFFRSARRKKLTLMMYLSALSYTDTFECTQPVCSDQSEIKYRRWSHVGHSGSKALRKQLSVLITNLCLWR